MCGDVAAHFQEHVMNIKNETRRALSTRPGQNEPAVTTNVTFDWSNVTGEMLQAGYEAYATIKLQQRYRKHGIPEADTVDIATLAPGVRAARAPESLASIVERAKSDPAMLARLLEELQAAEDEEASVDRGE